MYDVIILGRGPAGLSASLYTVRAKLKTLIIGKENSSLKKADKIENYFGFSKPVSGEYLLREGEEQAKRLGVDFIDDEAISIEIDDSFQVITSQDKFSCKSVLLATGQPQKKLRIENFTKFEGRGVSYCSTCDGFFYNNLKVGILGHKDFAIHEAIELETFTKNLTIYTNGKELDISENSVYETGRFKINKKRISMFEGNEFIEKLIFDDGSSEDLDGIFIANESASGIDFARKLGIIINENEVVVDKNQQTNLKGVFAAGDCTGGLRQVSTSVGQGALAGRKITEYLREKADLAR